MKCCICGKEIEAREACNPMPVRTEGSCCTECDDRFVSNFRLLLNPFSNDYEEKAKIIQGYSYDELLECLKNNNVDTEKFVNMTAEAKKLREATKSEN